MNNIAEAPPIVAALPRLERVKCFAPGCIDGKVFRRHVALDGEPTFCLGHCAVCAGTGRILTEAS